MKQYLRILSFVAFFTASSANAGLLLEPYLGYIVSGGGDAKFSSGGSTWDLDYSGLQLGGRLGFSKLGLMAGLDYSFGSHEVESTSGATTFKDDVDRDQLGFFVGYQFPMMLRVWGTYFFNAASEGTQTGDHLFENTDEFSGSGMALGVGYTGLPFLSINLEYRTFDYDEWKSNGVDQANFQKYETTEILLSVSAPFDF